MKTTEGKRTKESGLKKAVTRLLRPGPATRPLAAAPPEKGSGALGPDATRLATDGRGRLEAAAADVDPLPGSGAARPGGAGDTKGAEKPRIERDPKDSNSTTTSPPRDGASPAVDAAYKKLPAQRRKAYDRVLEQVKGNPRARAALEELLVAGKLDDKALRGKKDLLALLDGMTSQKLASGIDRTKLIEQVAIELADPATINQKSKNSCGAATVQILLAKNNPAEYARLVSELASPEGKTQLANGAKVGREADWDASDGGRSIPSRLLQPTFMEYANGSADYDNTTDTSKQGSKTYKGLYNREETRLAEGVLGKDFIQYDTRLNGGKSKPADVLKAVESATKKGKTVPALVKYPDLGGHYVMVTGVRDGRVYYTNPWGREESMTADAFEAILWGANVPR